MSESIPKTGAVSLAAAGSGWVGTWVVETFDAGRELTFSDDAVLAASCGVRCPECGRFIMWTYPHPKEGNVLIRRLPVDQGGALTFLAKSAQQGSGGNVKADRDSLLSRLDGRDGRDAARAWCVECRGWRTLPLAALRTAIANRKPTIRARPTPIR